MITKNHSKIVFYLGLAGVLFSGYLSAVKLFSSTCAFGESCPYFLGYPACFYGFGLFLIIFLVALGGRLEWIFKRTVARIIGVVSFLGIIFSGYLTFPELKTISFELGNPYVLGLPTCAYGFVFYVLIFAVSVRYRNYI
jgi:hypothetical protein